MGVIEITLVLAAAFLAGLVDAVVGGGGLIQIPVLFAVLPQSMPATVFGTNKLSALVGTSFAALRYARRIDIPYAIALPAAVTAFAFSYGGAMAVSVLPRDVLRPLVLVLLVGVTVYTASRKELGATDQERTLGRVQSVLAAVVGALLGFYDGFFGPGTGSFLIFVFVRLFGFDFLRASVTAKVVNVATNLAALIYFGAHGYVLLSLGLLMAAFNLAGAYVGSHLALTRGSAFVRRVFVAVALVLIVKFGYDTFFAT